MNFSFNNYNTEGFYDEMFDAEGNVRIGYEAFKERAEQLGVEEFLRRHQQSAGAIRHWTVFLLPNLFRLLRGTENHHLLLLTPCSDLFYISCKGLF